VPKGLQQELKQTKPFQSLEVEAALSIARTAAKLDHSVAQALKPFGLTPTQYNVLRILRGAGVEGLCRNAVGERLVAPVPDVTRLLDRMEDAALISRERSGTDRRYVTTRITRKGLDLLDQIDAPLTALSQEQLGHLGRRNLRVLVDVLTKAREKL
jgi:DNA-binding MarR family transcriptional regulator